MPETTNMRCPVCGAKLVQSPIQRRYETILDHTSDPNRTPPLCPTFTCPNNCHPGFYGYSGELFSDVSSVPEKLWFALNSSAWKARHGIEEQTLIPS